MSAPLAGRKTYIVAVLAIVTAWASWSVGDLDMPRAIEATFAALMAMSVRAGVTSEAARAAKLILLAVLLLPLAACTTASTRSSIDETGRVVDSQGQPTSQSTMDADGNQRANHQGAAPTLLKQDAEGAWMNTPGQGGATVLTMPGGVSAYIWSPKDGEVASIKLTPEPAPGQPSLEITGMKFNVSEHAKVLAGMYADAIEGLKDMTRAEAERRVKEWEQAGKITSEVAAALLRVFVPTLPIQ